MSGQALPNLQKIGLFVFENERIVLEGNNDLIFVAFLELYPEQDLRDVYAFFDEIHEVAEWILTYCHD